MKFKQLILFIFMFTISNFALAKRMAPPDVSAITHGNIVFSVKQLPYTCKNITDKYCGYHEVVEASQSGKLLWQTKIFQVINNEKIEQDVQDVFPASLQVIGNKIMVKDERGVHYKLGLKNGKLLNRSNIVIYYLKG